MKLHDLKNTHRARKKVQRVGRGPGSKRGKTSCRGQKGDGSRSGYKRRYGYEGGGVPLHRRLPIRGFTRGRFYQARLAINLDLIEKFYHDGEVVSEDTLRQKGLSPRRIPGGLKILSRGELTKNVRIEAHRFSKEAIRKLEEKKIPYQKVS
ncbi:MAG: 50S ribosomal protein L15 [Chlamydiota bacterium]